MPRGLRRKALIPAVAAVDRQDVPRVPDPLAGRGVDALARGVERRRDGRIAALGVGDRQGNPTNISGKSGSSPGKDAGQ